MMAGRGGLNLTHSESLDVLMTRYGAAASWLAPAIKAFSPEALRSWSASLGQETFVGSSGRIFPRAMKASPLLRAWLKKLNALGVRFALRHRWKGWDENGHLLFKDAQGQDLSVAAEATILALGGGSWARLGSDGSWVNLLHAQGIKVAPLRPANCGFIAPWSPFFAERFAGQPIKPVIASFAGKTLQGEMMLTRTGVEGGVIYALSSLLRDALEGSSEIYLTLDLRPGLSVEALTARLDVPRGSQSFVTYLRKTSGLSPAALGLLRENLGGAALPMQPKALAQAIKETRVRLTAPASLDRAISSAGGVCRQALDAHLMLKEKPGVFVIGEMLDWEAPTGGYLLQACFSTAQIGAEGALAYVKKCRDR